MTTAHDPRFADLLAAHALGALDGEDLAALESHLAAGCPTCEAELSRWRRDVEQLAVATPPVEPSRLLRARLLRRAAEATAAGAAGPSAAGRGPRWLAGLAAAVAIAVLAWGWMAAVGERDRARQAEEAAREQVQRAEETLARARAETQLAQVDCDGLRAEAASWRRLVPVLAAAGGYRVDLAATTPGSTLAAWTFVDPSAGRAVFLANLPAIAVDRDYQLWTIAGGSPVSAGLIRPDPAGHAVLTVESRQTLREVRTWAVSIEPQGGSNQPTGPIVLAGNVG